MNVREAVYQALTGDPVLNGMGINTDTVYGGQMTVDSPEAQKFVVLRWGQTEVGPGRRPGKGCVENLAIWAYNRQTDYGPILDILARCRVVLDGIVASNGIIQVDFQGSSEDLWDDVWRAITRNHSYRIPTGGA